MNFKEVLKTLLSQFQKDNIDVVLSGGFALGTMGIFRMTRDLDFLVDETCKDEIHRIMLGAGYELQDFSNEDIKSYLSGLKVFGQVDFRLARRKYTRAMIKRAKVQSMLAGSFQIKTLLPEDLIGLKVQAMTNDPVNRTPIDASDIQRLLSKHQTDLDMALVREYFLIFNKEGLLDEWIDQSNRI